MIKVVFICSLLCVMSCSTSPNKKFQFKSIPAANKAQGRSIIQNHLNFLQLLFEQSKDPYYNVPKWTTECLEENKIGKVTETGQHMQAISFLYVNDSNEVGHCSRSSKTYPAYVIYVYCDTTNEVREIKYRVEEKNDLESINLCE